MNKNIFLICMMAVLMVCASLVFAVSADEVTATEVTGAVDAVVDDAPYYAIYDMLGNAFYGDVTSLTGDQSLVLTALSTSAVVIIFCIPFLMVFSLLKLLG